MTPRTTAKSPHIGRGKFVAIALLTLLGVALPGAASATLSSITTKPAAPTVCDTIGLLVAGVMPDPCYHVIGAVMEGPIELPTAGPIPTYEIRVRITVQEPNPLLDIACPTVLEPYERAFWLDQLPFGRYFVRGVEYLVPFSTDSTVAPKDSSKLDSEFDVRPSCPPPGCYILSFAPRVAQRVGRCDATAPPGGTACFDVALMNESPVGGVQTEITLFEPGTDTPIPFELLHPISVEVARRAAGFQVAWTANGSAAKILLFTTGDATIPKGEGPILHVCYAVAPAAPEGLYIMRFKDTIAADPAGGELMPCPTIALEVIVGTICVAKTASCDVNEDGASDILDVIQLVNCALAQPGGSNACPDSVRARADCNGDGVVNIRDVICCVRKILDSGGFEPVGGDPADSTGATRIGFTGPVQWISPYEGRATIEILPGTAFGGIQFGIEAGSSSARIRQIRLFNPTDEHQLEISVDPGGGSARAMLFPAFTAIRAPDPIRLEVVLEPVIGPPGNGGLELFAARSATQTGQAMATRWTAPTAEVPQNPGADAPSLSVPAPNPFAIGTEIAYSLPTPRRVTLRVYSVSGRLIRTLVDASKPAGFHRAQWDGRDSAGREARSGIYFFKFVAGDVERTARVMRLR
jgi:hypothetical protein